jgi:hypothetical protein
MCIVQIILGRGLGRGLGLRPGRRRPAKPNKIHHLIETKIFIMQ